MGLRNTKKSTRAPSSKPSRPRAKPKTKRPPQAVGSDYAQENKQRLIEWEPGFRQRIEWAIDQCGGPGKVQMAAHIKGQTLQKMRKGGQRYCLLASFIEATDVNPAWLLLGGFSEPRWRSKKNVAALSEESSHAQEPTMHEPAKTDPMAHGRVR